MTETEQKYILKELGYEVIASADETDPSCVEFKVWEHYKDGSQDCDPQYIFLDGGVRWDGCSNWVFGFGDSHCAMHFCSAKDAENLGKLLRQLYEIAAQWMPSHADQILEKPWPASSATNRQPTKP
jgi:hypothetical protein